MFRNEFDNGFSRAQYERDSAEPPDPEMTPEKETVYTLAAELMDRAYVGAVERSLKNERGVSSWKKI